MATPPLIFVLNGPNLNLLGRASRNLRPRTLDDIADAHERPRLALTLDIRQSNHEGI